MREKVTLGSLCNPPKKQVSLEGDTMIDYFDISSVDNACKEIISYETYEFSEAPSRARKLVDEGNIIISTVRPNLNAVAMFGVKTANIPIVSTGFCVLDCKENVDPGFVFNFCKSKTFIEDMVSKSTGASYPAVSDKIIREATIPLYSYAEQKTIASKLEKVTTIITLKKQELNELDNLIKSRFVELFGDIVLNPKCFTEGNVSEYCKMTQGTQIPMSEQVGEYQQGYYRYLYIRDLKYNDDNWIYVQDRYDDKKLTDKDLVVVNTGNTAGEIYYGKDGILSNNLFKVSFDSEILNTNYMYAYFSSKQFQNMLWSEMKEGTQPHLGHKIFGSKKLLVPPIELQNQFAEFIQQVDKLKFRNTKIINTQYTKG